MQENNDHPIRPQVMVRAWGDEPVKLSIHRIENKRCYVGNEVSKSPVGLPNDQVFVFDLDRSSLLCTAFKHGDADKLGELWAKMTVDDFACNKYQISLECSHDQEHFTDSESAPSSDTR